MIELNYINSVLVISDLYLGVEEDIGLLHFYATIDINGSIDFKFIFVVQNSITKPALLFI